MSQRAAASELRGDALLGSKNVDRLAGCLCELQQTYRQEGTVEIKGWCARYKPLTIDPMIENIWVRAM